MQVNPTGLYIHVPFCARACDYCAFYQAAPEADGIRRYFEGLEREIELLGPVPPIETVFWGGGTPGLLSAKDLHRLGTLVHRLSPIPPKEWTIEMTPLSASEARLKVLRELGVTRISLGVQSFQPRLLEALGRDHKPAQAFQAYERVRAAGFPSVNLDLMFSLPGQDHSDWQQDLEQALALGPDHLSTYCLTFEEDTRLWLKLSKGVLKRDVETEARLYAWTWERLAAAGLPQYEISNFARAGHRSLHNLNTWRMTSWVGLGPSAASQYQGWRGTNYADLDEWLRLLAAGRRATEDRQELGPALLAEDAIVFGLRMNEGIDTAPWRERFPQLDWPRADTLASNLRAQGILDSDTSVLRLSDRGRMVADSAGEEFVGLFSQD